MKTLVQNEDPQKSHCVIRVWRRTPLFSWFLSYSSFRQSVYPDHVRVAIVKPTHKEEHVAPWTITGRFLF